jgi:NADPH2:quinone reductase
MPRAIRIHRYGPPEVLRPEDVTLPELQPDEVRFRVLAAPVNRSDLEIRSGRWPIQAPQPFPYTPGLEALGDVVGYGADVQGLRRGDRVVTMMQKLGGIHGVRPGGYQEFVTVEASKVASVPHELDPWDIAALGLAGVTALNGLRRLELEPGQTLVVHGASGGIGSAAVRLARALGVRVIGTSSGTGKDAYLRALGCDEIVHLDEQRLSEQPGAQSVDAVLDPIGGPLFADSVAILKRGGRLCVVGAAAGEALGLTAWDLLQDLHLTGYSSENLTGAELRADMVQLCTWLAEGRIAPPPYRRFPLEDAAQVHELMQSGRMTGRALLVP